MRPNDRDLLQGIRTTLADIVAPEVNDPLAKARLGMTITAVDMVMSRWDTQVQELLDTYTYLVAQFRRAMELLNGNPEAPEQLMAELRAATADEPPSDYRLTTLIERNNRMNALLIRLMETCDLALERPGLAALLPLRDELLQHVRREAQARSVMPGPAARRR